MNHEEKDILQLINNIPEEEMVKLLEDIDLGEIEIDDIQKSKMKKNVMNRVKTASKQKLIRRVLIAAGIVIIIAISAISPFGQKAIAEIAKKLYYVPGSSFAERIGENIYILAEPIKYSAEGNEITIVSITKDVGTSFPYNTGNQNNEALTINITGTGYFPDGDPVRNADGTPGSWISVIDENGKSYGNTQSGLGSQPGHGWDYHGVFTGIPADLTSFKLIVLGNEIPVILKKAEVYSDYASMGPTDIKNGVGITLISKKEDGIIKFNLIQHKYKNKEINTYGTYRDSFNINISYYDDKGNILKVDKVEKDKLSSSSEFYFKPLNGTAKYVVEIPEVSMMYNDGDNGDINSDDLNNNMIIKLPVPKEGEMSIDKTFDFFGFDYKFTRAERRLDSVRIYVDTGYDKNAPENIWRVNFFKADQSNEGLLFSDAPPILNEDEKSNYLDFVVKPNQSELKFKLGTVNTTLRGPWTFEIPAE